MKLQVLGWLVALAAFAQSANEVRVWASVRQNVIENPVYFEESMRNSALPVHEGVVVSMEPETRPHTLLIGIETPLVAELRLRIQRDGQQARMRTTPPRKSKVFFRSAMAESFTKQPFLVTAVIEEHDLDYEDEAAH